MTPQEQQMIESLIARIQSTPVPEKDSDAERLLEQGLGRNPDALYLLSQTVIVQGYALEQAQKQLADARSQLTTVQHQQQPKHTSFLGSIFGSPSDDSTNQPPPRPTAPPPPQYAQPPATPQYAPVPGYSQAPPAYPPPFQGQPSGAGGFLRNAMQTASGVAAGALAFQGIESLMHGFGHATGYGDSPGFFGAGSSLGGGAPREEIVNNYYGDSTSGEHHDHDISGTSPSDLKTAPTDFSSSDVGSSGDYSSRNSGDNDALFKDASYADTGSNEDTITYPDDSSATTDNLDSNDSADDSGNYDSGGDDTSI